jgi:hypothetical protein
VPVHVGRGTVFSPIKSLVLLWAGQGDFQFWKSYEASVDHMLAQDEASLRCEARRCHLCLVLRGGARTCEGGTVRGCCTIGPRRCRHATLAVKLFGKMGVFRLPHAMPFLTSRTLPNSLPLVYVRAMAPSEDVLASQLEYLHTTRKHFDSVLDEAHYNEMRERKEKRLSFKARGYPYLPPPSTPWPVRPSRSGATNLTSFAVSPYRPCKLHCSSPCTM